MNAEDNARTWCDVIFHTWCSSFGLQTSFRLPKWVTFSRTAFRLLMFTVSPFAAVAYSRYLITPQKNMTFADITNRIGAVIYAILGGYAIFLLHSKRRNVEPLLRKDGRGVKSVLLPLASSIPHTGFMIIMMKSTSSVGLHLTCTFCIILDASLKAAFTVYLNIVSNLIGVSERLKNLSRDERFPLHELVDAKWALRDEVLKTNQLFKRLIFGEYLYALLAVTYLVAKVVRGQIQNLRSVLLGAHTTTYVMLLLYLALKSSKLQSNTLEAERRVLMRSPREASCRCSRSDLLRNLRYREELDSLLVGCFAQNATNFFKLVSIMITVIPVVLQFDHEVVRKINDVANIAR